MYQIYELTGLGSWSGERGGTVKINKIKDNSVFSKLSKGSYLVRTWKGKALNHTS